MGSTSSSQPVSKTEAIQKISGTFQLFLLPEDLLLRILKLLDTKTLISRLLSTCKLFRPSYKECSVVHYPFLGYLGYIYEAFIFSKGSPLIQPTPKDNFQPHLFRPNVNLSLNGIKQPTKIRLHVFTISDSKEIRFDEIVSMVIELPNNAQIDVQTEALKFLEKLVETPLGKLKRLKISGFLLNDSLFASLSKFSLDWLYLIHPVFEYDSSHIPLDLTSTLGFRKLHMKLWDDCDLYKFPKLPNSLEEFSLHISSVSSARHSVVLPDCTSLKKL